MPAVPGPFFARVTFNPLGIVTAIDGARRAFFGGRAPYDCKQNHQNRNEHGCFRRRCLARRGRRVETPTGCGDPIVDTAMPSRLYRDIQARCCAPIPGATVAINAGGKKAFSSTNDSSDGFEAM